MGEKIILMTMGVKIILTTVGMKIILPTMVVKLILATMGLQKKVSFNDYDVNHPCSNKNFAQLYTDYVNKSLCNYSLV